MIVFKTFLKILNKNKFIIILYTVFLIGFGGFNMQTSDNSTNFVASKPDIMIVNYDEEKGITKDLIKYITDNSNIIELNNNEEAINDGVQEIINHHLLKCYYQGILKLQIYTKKV